jgi:hypothetical protein
MKQKRCDELAPGTLESNKCDGSSPVWLSTVVHVNTAGVHRCSALQVRGNRVLIASNVYRGMWRTLWEP